MQEENEVPDDETVNQMVARTELEFEQFQKMDLERRREEAKMGANRKSRLLEISELPDWLVKEEDEVDTWNYDENESILGRGTRQRKEVDYTDSLTEKEWLKAIDETGDYDDEEDEEEKVKKKKGRKKRKRGEDSDSEVGGNTKKRSRTANNFDSKLKKQMRKLMNIVTKYTDSDGRLLSEPFMKLPPRKDYPDYYDIIKKPIDINKILNRIEDGKYSDFSDLERDFMLLCSNAQIYNEEASLIHEDSIVLQSVFSNARQRIETDGGESEGGEEEKEDGNKSDTDSTVKMKIKLKNKKTTGRRKRNAKRYVSDDEDEDDD